MNNLVNVQIETKDGVNVVSSKVIAEQLGKRHDHVIRDLYKIVSENPDMGSQIIESTYKVAGNNKTYKEYLLTKDGFTLYMFNIQGYNDFKMAYINKFNEMERALQETKLKLPGTYLEALKALVASQEEKEQLALENQEMKPHAILGQAITAANSSILIGDLAKLLRQNGIDIGQNRLFEWMRKNGYLVRRKGNSYNMPTQSAMEMGLFEIKESVHIDGNGCNKITRTPKVTGKGQSYFINKFLCEY